jgi:uncharacterized membrane protein (UPF0127 family)
MARRQHFLQPLLEAADATWALGVVGRETTVASTIETAFDSKSRNRGLIGRERLAPGTALVIAPTSAVHTFGMRFPIDILFAARDGRLVRVRARVPRRRIALAWGAFAAIELAAGEADRAGLRPGDQVCLRGTYPFSTGAVL